MNPPAEKPWIEIRRKLKVGSYVSYANIYRNPLRVWILGKWIHLP